MVAIGNYREESRLHALLTMEKSRDRSRRLRTLKPRSKGAVLNRFNIETPVTEEEAHITRKYIILRYEQ